MQGSVRFFRDMPTEPFVVVMDLRYMMPVLVWRQHTSTIPVGKLLQAFAVINQIASEMFGEDYLLVLQAAAKHFFIRIRLLESFYEREISCSASYNESEHEPLAVDEEQES